MGDIEIDISLASLRLSEKKTARRAAEDAKEQAQQEFSQISF